MSRPRNPQDQLLDVLLRQYEQLWSDKRNYDNLVWQTPTISLGIVVILISGLAAVHGNVGWALVAIIGFTALAVVVVGIVQLRKHRLFQMITVSEMQHTETAIRRIVPNMRSMGFKTPSYAELRNHYPDVKPLCPLLDERKAYNWLFWLMCLVGFGLLVFTFFSALCAVFGA